MFAMDSAQCQLYAEGVVPNFDADPIYTGRAGRDLAINAGVAVIVALAQAAAISQKRDLCMTAKGYIAHAPGAQPAVAGVPIRPAPAMASTPPMTAGPTVPLSSPPMLAGGPIPVAPACPLGLNPRWSNPEIGAAPMMICIQGNSYPPFLWRYAGVAYSF
jgi:hypothetical protein